MKSKDLLIFMPVGGRANLAFMADTIDSLIHYIDQDSSCLLIINDTQSNEIFNYIPNSDNILVFNADRGAVDPTERQTRGNLFFNQVKALKHASKYFDWKCAMRLDDDALVTGPNPQLDALRAFRESPSVGMLGAHIFRGDGSNKEPAMKEKGRLIVRQLLSRKMISKPTFWLHWATMIARTLLGGKKLGYMCTGGAFFISRPALDKAITSSSPFLEELRLSALDDDVLFAFYVAANGFSLSDFSRENDIMGINWQGLPMPLERLVELKKKVIHSVKDASQPGRETEVRAFFRDRRNTQRSSLQQA